MKKNRHTQISAETIRKAIGEKIQEMKTRGQETSKTKGAITDFCKEVASILGVPPTNRSFCWRISQVFHAIQEDNTPLPQPVVKVKKVVEQPIVIEMSQEEQGTFKAIKEVARQIILLRSDLNDIGETLRGLQSEIMKLRDEISALREDVNEGAILR